MRHAPISTSRLKDEAEAMSNACYFVDALATFISDIAAADPCLCDKALNGYAVGGLMTGLRIVGSSLMARGDEFTTLLKESEQQTTEAS